MSSMNSACSARIRSRSSSVISATRRKRAQNPDDCATGVTSVGARIFSTNAFAASSAYFAASFATMLPRIRKLGWWDEKTRASSHSRSSRNAFRTTTCAPLKSPPSSETPAFQRNRGGVTPV